MATTNKTKKKPAAEILRTPGPKQLQLFLASNSKLFNFSELERLCQFPSGTLRHICAQSREMDNRQYETVQQIILPKLCEFVFLLQNYQVNNNRASRFSSWNEY